MSAIPALSIHNILKISVLFIVCTCIASAGAYAKGKTGKQDVGIDQQVLEIKSEVLSIAKELEQLEKRLLYPSHTEVAVFISMRKKQQFRLESIDIKLDGRNVAYHIYSPRELQAFSLGGVQKIYTGNVTTGKHGLKVTMRGKKSSGDNILLEKDFQIEKDLEPGIVELMLGEGSITLIPR